MTTLSRPKNLKEAKERGDLAVNIEIAAQAISISSTLYRRLIRKKQVPFMDLEGRIVVPINKLEEFMTHIPE